MKFKINQKVYVHSIGVYGFVENYSGLRYMVTLDTGHTMRYSEEDITDGN